MIVVQDFWSGSRISPFLSLGNEHEGGICAIKLVGFAGGVLRLFSYPAAHNGSGEDSSVSAPGFVAGFSVSQAAKVQLLLFSPYKPSRLTPGTKPGSHPWGDARRECPELLGVYPWPFWE